MRKNLKISILTTILVCALTSMVNAQTRFQVDLGSSSAVVKGTSTIHDWEMKSTEYSAWAIAEVQAGESITIKEGSATFKSSKILSDNSSMDKKAHEALKVSAHPDITFKITSPATLPVTAQKATGTLKGELTIAGVKKAINLPVTIQLQGDSKWSLVSTIKVKMSDYGIAPPTALMGTVKSGDAIDLAFNLVFIKK